MNMLSRENSAVKRRAFATVFRAYGKAGNGNEMETGNGNWKRKMEMEIGNGNVKVAGFCPNPS